MSLVVQLRDRAPVQFYLVRRLEMRRIIRAWLRWLRSRLHRAQYELLHPRGGPAGQLARRLTFGIGVIALIYGAIGFSHELKRGVSSFCKITLGQPTLMDTCVTLGIPGVAKSNERLAWAEAKQGDCRKVIAYEMKYPRGIFREDADRALARRTSRRADGWTLEARTVGERGVIPGRIEGYSTKQAAILEAETHIREDVTELLCVPSDDFERLIAIRVLDTTPSCIEVGGRHSCALEYHVTCQFEERKLIYQCL